MQTVIGLDVEALSREELEAEVLRLRAERDGSQGTAGEVFGRPVRSTAVGRDELFSAIEKTRMPMILTDPNQPDDPIIFVNRAFLELSGYPAEELIGRNCRFLQGPETDPSQVQRIRDALAAKQDIALDLLNYRRDGSTFVNELFISPVLGSDGQVLYHFGGQLDVTGYRRDRQKLETSERRQRAVFSSAVQVAIVVTDRDGAIVEWNIGAQNTFGWSAEEMRGQPADRLFTPEDRARDRAATEMRIAIEDGRASDERWHLRKDGSRFWASGEMMPLRDDDGTHLGFIKIARDRTADHLAGRALEEAQARLRHAQEAGGIGLFTADIADDMVRPTPEFCRLYGLPVRDSYPAKVFEERVVPEDAHLVSNATTRSRGEIVRDTEYRIRRVDTGEERWIARKGEVERDENGKPVRFSGVVRDITEQRSARSALARSEARYRTFVESVEVAFAIVEVKFDRDDRPVDYRFLEANPAFERHAGVNLRGKWVTEFAPDLERFWFETYGRVARTGEPANFENYAEAFGRWFDVRALRIGDPAARQIAIFFNDVTAQRQLQTRNAGILKLSDRLRDLTEPRGIASAAAEILGTTLKASLVGYGVVDAATETITVERDWAVEGVRSLPKLIHFRDYGSYFDNLRRGETVVVADVMLDPRTAAFAADLEAIGARAFINLPLFERGQFVALIYVGQADVRAWTDDEVIFVRDFAERIRAATERAQREKDLRASEALTREYADRVQLALGAGAIIGTWFWDLPTDRFTVDEAFARSFGLDPALGRIGLSLEQVIATVHPDDREGLVAAINEAVARGGAYAHQYRTRRADGNYYWLEANGRVDHAPDGTPLSFPGVLLDIEERRAVEAERERVTAMLRGLTETLEQRVVERTAELMKTEEALRQSQKMEAVGQLTGGLAHDFNNLLAGITGSLDLMSLRLDQGRIKDLGKYMVAAQGAAKRAAALTHRLLAFSRRQTLAPKPTDVNRLVAGMEDLVQRTVGPGIKVETVGAAGLWTALVDASQLENALLNLCINARDAMPDGGRITIETANKWIDQAAARQRDMPEGQFLSLCVTDTGVGMSPDVIAKVFEPFFTTKPLGEGTGLGLSMIYGFAQQSGGQVRIHSIVGEGTTVCIYLPRHLGEADAGEAPADRAAGAPAASGETVLVVDDEPTVRMLVTDILEDLGYTAIEASDSAAGLRVLQSDARIDLLITDVGLPGGMNGRQMADAGLERRPDLKVLFITGYAENAVVSHGHLAPTMQILTKPFAVDALAARIRELVAG